jgi:hypothetical protein
MMKPVWRTVAWMQGLDIEGKLADFDIDHFTWPRRDHDVLLLGDVKSTNLPLSRSAGIHLAKNAGVSWLVMPDADTAPDVNLNAMLSLLNQAARQGYGIIISPAVNENGSVGVLAPGGVTFETLNRIPEGLFEIGGGTGGWMAFSKECLSRMTLVKKLEVKRTGKDSTFIPVYYEFSETSQYSEDYQLLNHVRDTTGLKIGADTRLWTTHGKLLGIPSYRGGGEGIGRQG